MTVELMYVVMLEVKVGVLQLVGESSTRIGVVCFTLIVLRICLSCNTVFPDMAT